MHEDWWACVPFSSTKRPIRLIFIHERGQDCLVRRFLMGTRQMGSRLQCFLFFFFFLTSTWNTLWKKKTHLKTSHIRSDQCEISKSILLFFSSVSPHVWRFQASNSLPSWESFWHSSTWKSSTEKQPDLYTFWSVHLRSNTHTHLCSSTHGSRGRVIRYGPHFLSWPGEIRSGVETG